MKYKILRCHKCKSQMRESDMGKKCPICGEWQYHHKAEVYFEESSQTTEKAKEDANG